MAPSSRRLTRPWPLLAPTLTAYLFLLVIPVAFVVVYSLWLGSATGLATQEWTLQNWKELLGDPFYWAILWQTLRIAMVSTLDRKSTRLNSSPVSISSAVS